jgi:hypothetical protein
MISFNIPQTARASRKEGTISGGGATWRSDYLLPKFPDEGEGVFPLPQAFSVEQSPQSVSLPHFHDEDQFQVIAQGGGTLGRHAVGAFSVHYTNRQTGYGPIVAGEQGLTYFTLRQIATKGIWYLANPDAKEKLDRTAPKRQATVGPLNPKPPEELRALQAAQTDTLIEPHEDGLAAWVVRVPAGASVAAPAHPNGTGRYFMVLGGAMRIEGQDLPAQSVTFVSHDEKGFSIAATGEGAEVLVLQYPGGQRVLERRAKPMSQQGPMKKQGGLRPGT